MKIFKHLQMQANKIFCGNLSKANDELHTHTHTHTNIKLMANGLLFC